MGQVRVLYWTRFEFLLQPNANGFLFFAGGYEHDFGTMEEEREDDSAEVLGGRRGDG